VVSNGLLVEETDLPDGRRRTHWRQSVPIAPWLYVLGVARFAVQHVDTFDGKAIQTWVYAKDRDAGFHDFAVPTRDALAFYSERVGPFSYEKLANVQSNSVSGGMEAASAIFYSEGSVTGTRSERWRNVVIHEVAHQWFGNAVTEYDWDDVWLSEGFATYFTLLFIEHAYGRDEFLRGLEDSRQRVIAFDRKQPDLNWEHPEVRRAVYDMMRWWLDRGVDGFRMDVINLISKHVELPDGPVRHGRRWGDGGAFYTNGPRLHEYLQEMHREVFDGRDGLITVGETPGVTVDDAVLFTDPARREVDMVFQFEHVGLDHGVSKFRPRPLEPGELAASLTRWQEGLHDTGWNSLYLENHDQPRSVSRFGDDEAHWRASATALATMLHLQRGTPYVYQGQELGMTNAPFAVIDEFRDVESLNAYAEEVASGTAVADAISGLSYMSRDHARTPMQWDASPNAGFTDGTPWIAVNPNHDRVNAAAQAGDPDSVFEYYRRLIALRHERPVVGHGSFERADAGHPAIFAFERVLGDDRLLVVANLSSAGHVPAFAAEVAARWRGARVLLANEAEAAASVDAPLGPWAARVFELG
jgi:glycosidase